MSDRSSSRDNNKEYNNKSSRQRSNSRDNNNNNKSRRSRSRERDGNNKDYNNKSSRQRSTSRDNNNNHKSRRSRSRERNNNNKDYNNVRRNNNNKDYNNKSSRHRSNSREYDKDNRYNNRERNREYDDDNYYEKNNKDNNNNNNKLYRSKSPEKSNNNQKNDSFSLYEQMNSIMSKSERRDKDPLIIDSSKVIWGKNESLLKEDDDNNNEKEIPKFKADFGLSGALAKDEKTGNIVNGVVLKFTEPIDAAIPKQLWRFYVFKGEEIIETLYLHRQSSYLFGRDDRVADLLINHPSCSKQHAVLQFRSQEIRTPTGNIREIKPYIMDLGSVHKTFLNNIAIEDARYYELKNKDMIKFGTSTREYVLIIDK